MGQGGTKTVAKRMASTNAPMKVTNKHFVLGNPIQGPFPDGMEKCVVGTGKTFFSYRFTKISIQQNQFYQDVFGVRKEDFGRFRVYTQLLLDIVAVRSIIRRIVKFARESLDTTKRFSSFGTRRKCHSVTF